MATSTLFSFLFVLFLSISISVRGSAFSVNLIHRDSPQSPFYNPLDTLSDRIQKAVHRSINRAHHFKKISSATYSSNHNDDKIRTSLSVIGIEFVMNISLGTPPLNVFAIADTGSDLTWVQCKPCENCYKQDSPLFDPKISSTYKDVPCASGTCKRFIEDRKDICENELCQYLVQYGDGSNNSTGNLAFETLTFASTSGRSIQLPNISFGCGHNNVGESFDEKGSGLVGLGAGKLSLISQLGSKIDSKFSYCLVPSHNVSSKFTFGSNAEMIGKDVLYTQLISNPLQKTFYYLTLEGISVNENRVPFRSNSSSAKDMTEGFREDNYILIDSGTTYTFLPEQMYAEIESEVKKAINIEPITGPKDFNLCYSFDRSMKFPEVIVHFTDADIKLDMRNYFVHGAPGIVCLSFFPSESSYIYGNVAQINFLIEYALEEKKVFFKPTDCTKQD
ncbi:hypothetical protein MKW98_029398 [Papaver atlanticum]|uniref:Peptidase A1 domain-containing protein n=1 Tax=Papaver atlanticum TaxID=357466 RepID=A0AAD4XGF2_9MAGN|nr:hypothetical protein MKW98_029398 [Papaver atlanticum]